MNSDPDRQDLIVTITIFGPRGSEIGPDYRAEGHVERRAQMIATAAEYVRQQLKKASPEKMRLEELRNLYPASEIARQAFFLAINHLWALEGFKAKELLIQAVDREPGNALIHASLADAWSLLRHDDDALREATRASALAEQVTDPR